LLRQGDINTLSTDYDNAALFYIRLPEVEAKIRYKTLGYAKPLDDEILKLALVVDGQFLLIICLAVLIYSMYRNMVMIYRYF